MSLRRHPTTTTTTTDESSSDFPATDVMAPHNSTVAPAQVREVRDDVTVVRDDGVSGDEVVMTDRRGPGGSAGLIMGGFLALLISAWAGIIPFIGPSFGFSADGTTSWTWNHVHALGALAPGALGVIACLLVFGTARRQGLGSSMALRTWGFVLFLCGAWLTVVPVAWPVIVGPYFHAASPTTTLAYWMGYSSGPGVLLAAFGAYVIGRARCQRMADSTATM